MTTIDSCYADYGVNVFYQGMPNGKCAPPPPVAEWPANPEVNCAEGPLTAALLPCLNGASQSCCEAANATIAHDSGSASANCLCNPAVLTGALAVVDTVMTTIDSCYADYGVNVFYQGMPSGWCATPEDSCVPPAMPLGDDTVAVADTPIEVANEDDALKLLRGWEKNWLDKVEDKAKDYEYINVKYFASRSFEDTLEDASKENYPLLCVAYVLVVVYTVAYFLPWPFMKAVNPQTGMPPGPVGAFAAVCAIGLSCWGALGLAAFLCAADIKFNALTMQIVPFLGLGLGINDFFVLCKSLRNVVELNPGGSPEDLVGEMMAHGGVSVTLSSTTNTFVFFLSAISPIPAVRAFSLQLAFVEVFNYVLTLVVFPAILLVELRRYLAAVSAGAAKQAPPPPPLTPIKEGQMRFLANPVLKVAMLAANLGFVAYCGYATTEVKQGLELTDVLPESSSLYDYAIVANDHFCSRPVYLVYRDVPFEDSVQQYRSLEYQFVTEAPLMDVSYEASNFMRYYTEFVEGQLCSKTLCFSEVEYYQDKWRSTRDVCNGADDCATVCSSVCSHLGAPEDKKCKLSSDGTECFCDYRPMLKAEHFYNITSDMDLPVDDFQTKNQIRIMDKFLMTTLNGAISKWMSKFEVDSKDKAQSHGKVTSSLTLTFVEDVCDLKPGLDHVNGGRKIVDNSYFNTEDLPPGKTDPKNVYPFDWVVYALNEQYLNIEDNITMALVIAFCVMFVVMLPLIVHPLASLIVTLVLVCIEVELYGLLHALNLKLNAITMVNLLVAIGMSVEFTAHVGRAFMTHQGTRTERAVAAVREMGEPLCNGGMSTFCGIVPIAMTDYLYFRKYFFVQYLIILVIGLWNGLVFLPTVLSLFGPNAFAEKASSAPAKADEAPKDSDK